MTADLLLRYHATSSASDDAVSLATASPEGTPVFFDGYAEQPAQTARALLCVARVARTRFYEPPGMVAARIAAADPVVTAESDRLRFEAFSACCGVHARLDLLDDGLDVRSSRPGTTNVDFNPPMREALARIARREPLRVSVGEDSVEVQTLKASVVERRVPLPERSGQGVRRGSSGARRRGAPTGAREGRSAAVHPGTSPRTCGRLDRLGGTSRSGAAAGDQTAPGSRLPRGAQPSADPQAARSLRHWSLGIWRPKCDRAVGGRMGARAGRRTSLRDPEPRADPGLFGRRRVALPPDLRSGGRRCRDAARRYRRA